MIWVFIVMTIFLFLLNIVFLVGIISLVSEIRFLKVKIEYLKKANRLPQNMEGCSRCLRGGEEIVRKLES